MTHGSSFHVVSTFDRGLVSVHGPTDKCPEGPIKYGGLYDNGYEFATAKTSFALCLSVFHQLMDLCCLSQRQHAGDIQFQPACSDSRDNLVCA